MNQYILILKQATNHCHAFLYDKNFNCLATAKTDLEIITPKEGWCEISAKELWAKQMSVAAEVLSISNVPASLLLGIGIINQRETTIIWDRETGEPICNAILWSDRRTLKFCENIKKDNYENTILQKTGIIVDPYFSATKIKWILDHYDKNRIKAKDGKLAFGTVDSWLVWKLTNGRTHITDVTNAARTMLYNINTLEWDQELLNYFNIPKQILPKVMPSCAIYDFTDKQLFTAKVPIVSIIGDQQASLLGNLCLKKGDVKCSINNGTFVLANFGNKPIIQNEGLITTLAWQIGNDINYALEGSILTSGYLLQWLINQMRYFSTIDDLILAAQKSKDSANITIIPTFQGMGAPHWLNNVKGMILGLELNNNPGNIARAALETLAFQVHDIVEILTNKYNLNVENIKVDGIYSDYNYLMQIMSDILEINIKKNKNLSNDVLGAFFLVGLATGLWNNINEIKKFENIQKEFLPKQKSKTITKLLKKWDKSIQVIRYLSTI